MDTSPPLPPIAYTSLIDLAIAEDLDQGDVTTDALFSEAIPAHAQIITHEQLVVSGIWLVPEIFKRLNPHVQFSSHISEGQSLPSGTIMARIQGDGRSLLKGERVILNFLQRLCGITTITARFVNAVKDHKTVILDTRKTTPGWRTLEKYAVRIGGGQNHRMHLGDGILIKDNHLSLTGNIKDAVRKVKQKVLPYSPVEVEVKTLEELEAVLEVLDSERKDTVMLDNMGIHTIKKAVKLIRNRAHIEVSGGITLSNVREIAACGVDYISIGAITHSTPAVDISMDIMANG